MKQFSDLYTTLDQTRSTRAKVAAMAAYFARVEAAERAHAVFFLSGRRIKRLVAATRLREWLTEVSDLPAWLVEQTYADVGDLAETIALLVTVQASDDAIAGFSLDQFVEQSLKPLAGMTPDVQRERVTGWWQALDYETCFLVNKLMTGALRVGVSQALVASALAEVAGLPRPVILHRLMGQWTPDAEFGEVLIAPDDGRVLKSRPYPFCLASPLEATPGELSIDEMSTKLGATNRWQVEWKWDGIRGQLIRRGGETFLWSRGEDLITAQFPEIAAAAETLPDGTVLDGEILAWQNDQPMLFSALQRRLGRKKPGKKTLGDYPVIFHCYDLLEHNGTDIRDSAQTDRRHLLEQLMSDVASPLSLSPIVTGDDWHVLATLRDQARTRRVEGLMIKANDSRYEAGRKRGNWWKWKVEPFTVDAVMLYAQAGHGRRANLHTDYTFAVWRGGDLVPIAKAYSGLNNEEIDQLDKWIRRNTRERFGPVRSVEPVQVFELAFEAIARSSRHKSGVALRFPRIRRWRRDLGPGDVDRIEDLEALL
ncbi:MAG: ATP-dependent DNA ligase [Pseudomonadota bacterium]